MADCVENLDENEWMVLRVELEPYSLGRIPGGDEGMDVFTQEIAGRFENRTGDILRKFDDPKKCRL